MLCGARVNISVCSVTAAQFAGSFNVDSEQYGKQVFFFFREIAEEYIASKTKIYSRVAKVCKVSKHCPLAFTLSDK